jgi:hypothetical protein
MYVFLTLALAGGEWSASRPGCFTPRERAPGIHWLGGWVDPRAGLDDVEKRKLLILPGLELRLLGCPVHSQSLYRLCYTGSHIEVCMCIKLKYCSCLLGFYVNLYIQSPICLYSAQLVKHMDNFTRKSLRSQLALSMITVFIIVMAVKRF